MSSKKTQNQPREKLTQSQQSAHFLALNREFYDNFHTSYFHQKNTYLVAIIANPSLVEESLKNGFKSGLLEIHKNDELPSDKETEQLLKNLKTEIAMNYMHSVETLFRLIFAHAGAHECPWLEICLETNFVKFKDKVRDFVDRKYFKDIEHRDGLAVLFFGSTRVPNQVDVKRWNDSLDKLDEFLHYYGGVLLSPFDYNSFKHGGAVFGNQLGLKFGELINVEKDDSLVYLTYENGESKDDHKILHRETILTKWESKFALTYRLTSMVENIIAVGRSKYLKEDSMTLKTFEDVELHPLISRKDNMLEPLSIKEPIFLFKRSEAHD